MILPMIGQGAAHAGCAAGQGPESMLRPAGKSTRGQRLESALLVGCRGDAAPISSGSFTRSVRKPMTDRSRGVALSS